MLTHMGHLTLRDIVPFPEEIPESVEEASQRLEDAGWYPRSRWGKDAVRYWQDQGRGHQCLLGIHASIGCGRARKIAEITGVDLSDLVTNQKQKGEKDASNRLPSES